MTLRIVGLTVLLLAGARDCAAQTEAEQLQCTNMLDLVIVFDRSKSLSDDWSPLTDRNAVRSILSPVIRCGGTVVGIWVDGPRKDRLLVLNVPEAPHLRLQALRHQDTSVSVFRAEVARKKALEARDELHSQSRRRDSEMSRQVEAFEDSLLRIISLPANRRPSFVCTALRDAADYVSRPRPGRDARAMAVVLVTDLVATDGPVSCAPRIATAHLFTLVEAGSGAVSMAPAPMRIFVIEELVEYLNRLTSPGGDDAA